MTKCVCHLLGCYLYSNRNILPLTLFNDEQFYWWTDVSRARQVYSTNDRKYILNSQFTYSDQHDICVELLYNLQMHTSCSGNVVLPYVCVLVLYTLDFVSHNNNNVYLKSSSSNDIDKPGIYTYMYAVPVLPNDHISRFTRSSGRALTERHSVEPVNMDLHRFVILHTYSYIELV